MRRYLKSKMRYEFHAGEKCLNQKSWVRKKLLVTVLRTCANYFLPDKMDLCNSRAVYLIIDPFNDISWLYVLSNVTNTVSRDRSEKTHLGSTVGQPGELVNFFAIAIARPSSDGFNRSVSLSLLVCERCSCFESLTLNSFETEH